MYRSNQLGDEQLYLFLTILLAFSQVWLSFCLLICEECFVYELYFFALRLVVIVFFFVVVFFGSGLFLFHRSNRRGRLVGRLSDHGSAHPPAHKTHPQNERTH